MSAKQARGRFSDFLSAKLHIFFLNKQQPHGKNDKILIEVASGLPHVYKKGNDIAVDTTNS